MLCDSSRRMAWSAESDAAARYPQDYDGVVAHYPAYNVTMLHLGSLNVGRALYGDGGAGWIDPKHTKLITDAAYRSTAEDVQKLRNLGWSEDQIAEAVYIIAMFAFFNRVADAFGVPSQNYLETGKLTP